MTIVQLAWIGARAARHRTAQGFARHHAPNAPPGAACDGLRHFLRAPFRFGPARAAAAAATAPERRGSPPQCPYAAAGASARAQATGYPMPA
jgi:hypothetical protein